VKPVHLPHLLEFVHGHPDLRVVIDHAAKPQIRDHAPDSIPFQEWRLHMMRLARESRACVKLSGLVTEAAHDWDVSRLRPYVDVLLEHFGCERILWGSDWPVVELAGGYESWWRATGELLGGLDAKMRAAILGGNALSAYSLTPALGPLAPPAR
jgi:L-fuconolactonase